MAERELNIINANIRFLQAVHDSQFVDVFVNGKMVIGSLPFQKASSYVSLQPGIATIDIVSSDSPTKKFLSGNIMIESGKVYTVAAAGNQEKNKLLLIQNLPDVPYGEAKMRFLHLAENLPALDFAVKARDKTYTLVLIGADSKLSLSILIE
jgi:hypothetical protein